jgi:hypothetical protein
VNPVLKEGQREPAKPDQWDSKQIRFLSANDVCDRAATNDVIVEVM